MIFVRFLLWRKIEKYWKVKRKLENSISDFAKQLICYYRMTRSSTGLVHSSYKGSYEGGGALAAANPLLRDPWRFLKIFDFWRLTNSIFLWIIIAPAATLNLNFFLWKPFVYGFCCLFYTALSLRRNHLWLSVWCEASCTYQNVFYRFVTFWAVT